MELEEELGDEEEEVAVEEDATCWGLLLRPPLLSEWGLSGLGTKSIKDRSNDLSLLDLLAAVTLSTILAPTQKVRRRR